MPSEWTDKKLASHAIGSDSLSKIDITTVPWWHAMTTEAAGAFWWRVRFERLLLRAAHGHSIEDVDKAIRGAFEQAWPQHRFSPGRRVAACMMTLAKAMETSLDDGESLSDQDQPLDRRRIAAWLLFPYDSQIVTSNAERARFETDGVLPDGSRVEGVGLRSGPGRTDVMAKAATKKTSKKGASKKTSKKGASKKTTSKKVSATKAPAEKPKIQGVPDEFVSVGADGEAYDKRLGRPGTYKSIMCQLMQKSGGATRQQCVDAAIKAGLYDHYPKDEQADAAWRQWGMHMSFLRRNAENLRITIKEEGDDVQTVSITPKSR